MFLYFITVISNNIFFQLHYSDGLSTNGNYFVYFLIGFLKFILQGSRLRKSSHVMHLKFEI